jgi:hypothetical protein
MDQETWRLLITATASVTAGIVGALIGFFSAQRVAARTIAGQRQLALDKDVRDARHEATRSILALVDSRSNRFYDAAAAGAEGRFSDLERIIADLRTDRPASVGYLGILDPAFIAALERCNELEEGCSNTLSMPFQHMPFEIIQASAATAHGAARAYSDGATVLHRAAEAYWSQLT